MSDDVTIFGAEETERLLHEMGEKLMKQAIRDALDYSGNVLQVTQVSHAPIDPDGGQHPSGQLKQDIRRKIQLRPSEGEGTVAVGPSKHSFYGSFAEFGTSNQPAKPWMRPAFDESADEAVEVFCKVLAAHIEDYCNKNGDK